MRLATRLTLGIGGFAVLLFGGAGYVDLQHEVADLKAVAERETLLLARSLQTAVENALRDRQVEDVSETLLAVSQADPTVAIFVYDEAGTVVAAADDAQHSAQTDQLAARARATLDPIVEFVPPHSPHTLRLGLRLREESPSRASAIVLEKPLTELQRDLDVTRRNVVFTTGLFVLSVAALTWVLTQRYVGAPLARLVADMRQVRSGDLRLTRSLHRTDEVGDTQGEFDQLVTALEDARRRTETEIEARQVLERGLQQADKLITLGQLSAVMAHEIGSPLQVLEGRARSLRKHPEDPAATRRIADMLVEQTERITRIVGQMLSITRRPAAVRTTLDAEALVRRVIDLLELEASKRQVRLVLERQGVVTLLADADQLQQVALNLLRNALQASPMSTTVTVRLVGDAERVTLEVIDQGPGVPAESRRQLFEPFFTTKPNGSGLGLSVVKSIVREHRGEVDFVDREGGCMVRVCLPKLAEGASP